jgi:hypothetical protein
MYHFNPDGNKIPSPEKTPKDLENVRENYGSDSHKKTWMWVIIILLIVLVLGGVVYWLRKHRSDASSSKSNMAWGFKFY